jgi:hypothetical protein
MIPSLLSLARRSAARPEKKAARKRVEKARRKNGGKK